MSGEVALSVEESWGTKVGSLDKKVGFYLKGLWVLN